jgi:hypothetical protein
MSDLSNNIRCQPGFILNLSQPVTFDVEVSSRVITFNVRVSSHVLRVDLVKLVTTIPPNL